MRNVKQKDIGETLHYLHDYEIDFRLENKFDGGFVWVLVGDESLPDLESFDLGRVYVDDRIQNNEEYSPQFLNKDWLARGSCMTIEETIEQLCESVVRIMPRSMFTHWYLGRFQESN
jgi:hypothetical protein